MSTGNEQHGRGESSGRESSTPDETFVRSPGAARESLEQHRSPGESKRIGPFRILRLLGEGGMGQVYMAEQSSPVKRRVAVKVIKSDHSSTEVLARFETERQALALMDHPNIARVFSAGSTEGGQPYFAMEFVRGVPFTDYCEKNDLSLPERLRLLIPVARAIQHAHQKGIIHRDIKPGNVLVEDVDDSPRPKVIDFGLAKATQQKLTEKTLCTELGQIVGTPEYMSPEQAQMDESDIDTRTDVYSLGVLLYEVICGSTPLGRETMRGQRWDKVVQRICEEEPVRPSQKSRQMTRAHANTKSAASRREKRAIRSELDWIVIKALEKDRSRRYASAAELAEDLERYLNGDAVLARPPSLVYMTTKLVTRHRGAAAAGLLGLMALLLALTLSTFGYLKYRSMARAAEEQRQLAEQARKQAESREEELKRLNYFANIEQAGQRLREGNIEDAKRLLAVCPDEYRGWEHRYLTEISDEADVVISAHSDGVAGVDIDSQGERLLTTSSKGDIAVWDLARRVCVASSESSSEASINLPVPSGSVASAEFDVFNGRIVVWGNDGSVRYLDSEMFRVLSIHELSDPKITKAQALCFHGQGLVTIEGFSLVVRQAAAAEATALRETLRLDLLAGLSRAEKSGWADASGSVSIAVHPDGRTAIVSAGRLSRIDLRTGESEDIELRALYSSSRPDPRPFMRGPALLFDPGGRRILVQQSGMLTKFEGRTMVAHPPFQLSRLQYPTRSCFAAAGEVLITGMSSGQLIVRAVSDEGLSAELQRLNGHVASITDLDTSAVGDLLCTSSLDGTVRLWDLRRQGITPTGEAADKHFTSGPCGSGTPGFGEELFVDAAASVILYGAELLDATTLESKGWVTKETANSLLGPTRFRLWELADGLSLPSSKNNFLELYLRENVFVRLPKSGRLKYLTSRTGPARKPGAAGVSPAPEAPAGFAVNSAGNLLALATRFGNCQLIDLHRGELIWSSTLNGQPVPRFARGGKSVVFSGHEASALNEALILNIDGLQEGPRLTGIGASALSGDGQWFAFSDANDVISVISLDSTESYKVLGARPGVSALEFSADSERLLTSTQDGTLRLWDIRSGREIGILYDSGVRGGFSLIRFSSELGAIFAVDCSSEVYRWGVVRSPAEGDPRQKLLATRDQKVPDLPLGELALVAPEVAEILADPAFDPNLADPWNQSEEYRLVANFAARAIQLNAKDLIAENLGQSAKLRTILERETALTAVGSIPMTRSALALRGLAASTPENRLALLLDASVSDSVANEIIEALLLEGELTPGELIRELEQSGDAIVQARMLMLLTGFREVEADQPRLWRRLITSPNNLTRAALIRFLMKHKADVLDTLRSAGLQNEHGPVFNSAGQSLAYFVQLSDRGLGEGDLSAAQRSSLYKLAVSQTEVTREQFAEFSGVLSGSPSEAQTGISAVDMARFCNWISRREGFDENYRIEDGELKWLGTNGYRLPHKSEIRNLVRQSFGPAAFSSEPPALVTWQDVIGTTAVVRGSSYLSGKSVASAMPSRLGLFDVIGNVFEAYRRDPTDSANKNTDSEDPPAPAPAPAPAPVADAPRPVPPEDQISSPIGGGKTEAGDSASESPIGVPGMAGYNPQVGEPLLRYCGEAFWSVPGSIEEILEEREFRSPRSDVGFRVVRDILPDPPVARRFLVTGGDSGDPPRYISAAQLPEVTRTSFGRRVFFTYLDPESVLEHQTYTYTVSLKVPVTKTRTVLDARGEPHDQPYTVMQDVQETREGIVVVRRVVWRERNAFLDLAGDGDLVELNEMTPSGAVDLSKFAAWDVVDRKEEGVLVQGAVDRAVDGNRTEKVYFEIVIPESVYVPPAGQQGLAKSLPDSVFEEIFGEAPRSEMPDADSVQDESPEQ